MCLLSVLERKREAEINVCNLDSEIYLTKQSCYFANTRHYEQYKHDIRALHAASSV